MNKKSIITMMHRGFGIDYQESIKHLLRHKNHRKRNLWGLSYFVEICLWGMYFGQASY